METWGIRKNPISADLSNGTPFLVSDAVLLEKSCSKNTRTSVMAITPAISQISTTVPLQFSMSGNMCVVGWCSRAGAVNRSAFIFGHTDVFNSQGFSGRLGNTAEASIASHRQLRRVSHSPDRQPTISRFHFQWFTIITYVPWDT